MRTLAARTYLVAFLALVSAARLAAIPGVSRTAPPDYERLLAGQLTPVTAQSAADTKALEDPKVGGVVLVNEHITRASVSGPSLTVIHRAYKVTNETGVRAVGRITIPYLRDLVTPYLVNARTLRADGSAVEVADGAVFLQAPQREADEDVYNDYEELVIVFGDVQPGHVVELTVVLDQKAPRVPGELSRNMDFGFGWPALLAREVLEVPQAWSERLRIAPLGDGVPATVETDLGDGWVRYSWTAQRIPRVRSEIREAPAEQAGPSIWIGTQASWDEVAAWYSGLLAGGSDLDTGLVEQAEKWIGKADDRAAVIAALLAHVSEDVRYVGLEFGLGSLQPRPATEVWRSKYGDCKDKANLLRALLVKRGIAAHVALLNTDHAGRVEARIPSYRQFDHAIVAIEDGSGYRFVDPTMPYLPFGILPPEDTGRDVLVVRGGKGELVRIPAQEAGTMRVDADLELSGDGGLRGWMKLTADRFYGAGYAEEYLHRTKDEARQGMHRIAEAFFPGADVIDFEVPASPGGAFVARAFVVVPGGRGDGETVPLQFPTGDLVYPDLGVDTERRTLFVQRLETTEVTLRYALPAGWSVRGDLPRPLRLDAPMVKAAAAWHLDNAACTATLSYSQLQSTVAATSYPQLHQAIRALKGWLDTPVVVGAGGAHEPTPAETATVSLPLMPTGEGQLRLINRLYPSDGDPARRRAALRQALQLFKGDATTTFDAELYLAMLDAWPDGKYREAAERMAALLRSRASGLDRETVAFGEYMAAAAREDAGEQAAAKAIFERLARDPALSEFRRAWSCYRAALLARDGSSANAMRWLEEGLALKSEVSDDLFSELADVLAERHSKEEASGRLRAALAAAGDQAAALRDRLAEDVAADAENGELEKAELLLDVLETLQAETEPTEALQQARAAVAGRKVPAAIAAEITRYLADHRPDWWDAAAPAEKLETREQYLAAVERLGDAADFHAYIRCDLELLARFGGQLDDFADRLWRLAGSIESSEGGGSELLTACLGWVERLPHDENEYWEAQFVKARSYGHDGKLEEARAAYRAIAADEIAKARFGVAAELKLAELEEREGRMAAALEAYRRAETGRRGDGRAYDGMLRAALINLQLGHHDEALRIIGLFAELDEKAIGERSAGRQMRSLLQLAADPEQAKQFWKLQEAWVPAWQDLEAKLGLDPAEDARIVPVLGDFEDAGARLGKASNAKDWGLLHRELRTMVDAARWDPAVTVELAGLETFLLQNVSEHAQQLLGLLVRMCESFSSSNEMLTRRVRLMLAALSFDSAGAERAMQVTEEEMARHPLDDEIGRAVVRIFGLTAETTGKNLDRARSLLEAQLRQDLGSIRGVTVKVLCGVLRRQGAQGDEAALLARELGPGGLEPSDANRANLEARAQELSALTHRSSDFEQGVRAWLDRHRPAWFEFAPPASFADPRLGDPEAIVDDDGPLSKEEAIKARLLIALDGSQPLPRREWAFAKAEDALAELQLTWAARRAVRDDAIGEKRLGLRTRAMCLWMAVLEAFRVGDRAALERYAADPAAAGLQPNVKATLANLRRLVVAAPGTAADYRASAQAILELKVDSFLTWILRDRVSHLLTLGDFDGAQAVASGIDKAVMASDAKETAAGLHMQIDRLRREAKERFPLFEAYRNAIVEAYPAASVEPPAWRELADRSRLDHLDCESAFQMRLHRAFVRDYTAWDVNLWDELAGDLSRRRHDSTLVETLVRLGLSMPSTDDLRSTMLFWSGNWMDLDEPDQRARYTEILAPYRDRDAWPETYGLIRFLETYLALRTGKEVDPDAALRNFTSPMVTALSVPLRLGHYLQQGDVAGARRTIQNLSPEEMMRPHLLPLTLRAARLAGLAEEEELLAKSTEEERVKAIVHAWAAPDSRDGRRAFELAEAEGGKAPFPAGWLTHLLGGIRNEETTAILRLADAEHRADWAAAESAATAFLTLRPARWDFYWNLGQARAKLGKRIEAREALGTFVAHSHDSLHYLDGLELIDQLDAGVTAR